MRAAERAAFCSENGLLPPGPSRFEVVAGVGPKKCAKQFREIWQGLTGQQRRALLKRAGLTIEESSELGQALWRQTHRPPGRPKSAERTTALRQRQKERAQK
jgi:hypothetical protein